MFDDICNKLELGDLINTPEKLTGGITNSIYKVVTTKGIFAIKIINKDNILKNNKLLDKIENSEYIANILYNNIDVICANKYNNKYIQNIDDNYIYNI